MRRQTHSTSTLQHVPRRADAGVLRVYDDSEHDKNMKNKPRTRLSMKLLQKLYSSFIDQTKYDERDGGDFLDFVESKITTKKQ